MNKSTSKEYVKEWITSSQYFDNKPLNQIVFEAIRHAIIQGDIPVGERINEKEYSLMLNISRTPIREAIRRLEEEGLVEYVPNYGVIVKKVSIEDAKEIFELRKVLDSLATISAMERMTEKEFLILENELLFAENANKRGEIDVVIESSSKFNELIYTFSGKKRLKSIVVKLREYIKRFRDISLTGDERRENALDDHRKIFQLMKEKKTQELTEVLHVHLAKAEHYILKEMEQQNEANSTDKRK